MTETITISIPVVSNNGRGASVMSIRNVDLEGSCERMLSDQISAINFRLRESDASYSSDWHVAGDPTLLIVLLGTIKIELRSGETQIFSQGDMFIAEDYLPEGCAFNDVLHGHRAEVVGGKPIRVIHVKLDKRVSGKIDEQVSGKNE